MQRLRATHDCSTLTKLHAGHRLCRLRAAPGASAATATFSTSTFTFSTATSAATATTATAATAALAKPTSATTSTITSVAPLDSIQLHQYVRACLRRVLSRWRPWLAVTDLHGDLLLRLGWQLRRWRTGCRVDVLQPRHRLLGLRLSNLVHGHVHELLRRRFRLGW